MRIRKQIVNGASAFIISALLLLVIFYKMNIVPFGDNSMLVWDMEIQYSAFISWMIDWFHGNEAFPFSLQGGLGSNMVGLLAYYLASPLNILFALFQEKNIPFAVSCMLVLKTGLIATTMEIYLYHKKQDFLAIPFACIWALSSFVLCFQYNVMWMDALILFPLVIWGIDKILDDANGLMYVISLGVTIFSNYYMGFIVCLFSVVYFVVTFVYKYGLKLEKEQIHIMWNYAKYSIIAGGLSAIIIIPGGMVLEQSSGSRVLGLKDFLSLVPTFQLANISRYIWAGGFDVEQGITGKYPMLYAGNITIFLVLFFFFNREIERKKKMYYFALLFVVFIALLVRGSFLLWHGFCMPSGCYWRYAFLWIFICIVIAYESLFLVNREHVLACCISLLVICMDLVYLSLHDSFRIAYVLNLAFVVVWIAVLYLKHYSKSKRMVWAYGSVCLFMCVVELLYNGIKVHEVQFDEIYTSENEFKLCMDNAKELVAKTDVKQSNARTMVLGGLGNSYNYSYLYHLNSMDIYASTESQADWNIYQVYGLGKPIHETDSEFDYHGTELTASLWGIRYLIDYNWTDFPWYKQVETVGNCNIYENKAALPLAYLVNETALDIVYHEDESLFDNLNRLYHALLINEKDDPFIIESVDKEGYRRYADWQLHKAPQIFRLEDTKFTDGKYIVNENLELINKTMDENKIFTENIEVTGSYIKAETTNPSEKETYICFSIPYAKAWTAKVDGCKVETLTGMGGMLLIPIEQGAHEIVLAYHLPGQMIGIVVWLIALGALLAEQLFSSFIYK